MFRKDPLFIPGWIYFFLMFPLASRLPESFGCENGIIEKWQALKITKIPITSSILLLLFLGFSWVGERTAFFLFSGELAEELAEFGAYMMMFMMMKEAEQRLRQHT